MRLLVEFYQSSKKLKKVRLMFWIMDQDYNCLAKFWTQSKTSLRTDFVFNEQDNNYWATIWIPLLIRQSVWILCELRVCNFKQTFSAQKEYILLLQSNTHYGYYRYPVHNPTCLMHSPQSSRLKSNLWLMLWILWAQAYYRRVRWKSANTLDTQAWSVSDFCL